MTGTPSRYAHGNRVRVITTQRVGVVHQLDLDPEDENDHGFEQRYSVWDPWANEYLPGKWFFESELEPCHESVLELFGEPDPERYAIFEALMVNPKHHTRKE